MNNVASKIVSQEIHEIIVITPKRVLTGGHY